MKQEPAGSQQAAGPCAFSPTQLRSARQIDLCLLSHRLAGLASHHAGMCPLRLPSLQPASPRRAIVRCRRRRRCCCDNRTSSGATAAARRAPAGATACAAIAAEDTAAAASDERQTPMLGGIVRPPAGEYFACTNSRVTKTQHGGKVQQDARSKHASGTFSRAQQCQDMELSVLAV